MDKVRAVVFSIAVVAACGGDDGPLREESPCKAFARPVEPTLAVTTKWEAPSRRAFAGTDRTLVFAEAALRDGAAVVVDFAPLATAQILDVAMSVDRTQVFVLVAQQNEYRLSRFAVSGGPPVPLLEFPGGAPFSGALAVDREGRLFVALGDVSPSKAQDASSLLGKVLRLDVGGDRAVPVPEIPPTTPRREVWATGVRAPLGLSVDLDTGDVWLADARETSDELHRVGKQRNYGWPTRAVAGDFAVPIARLEGARRIAHPGAVVRDASLGGFSGAYVYASATGLVAVAAHGPSGTSEVVDLPPAPSGRVETGVGGEFLVLATPAVGVRGEGGGAVPRSLSETGCWDFAAESGAPRGAIPYDVAAPLWSDGAEKGRFVVVPEGGTRAQDDGDLVFPRGTVAVKTFSFGGRKVETRLLVQHERDDWVGYSYAWNEQGTDAELVSGNRRVELGGGGSWYFPSRSECAACHTAAAAFTLGLETRQTGAALFTKLAPDLPEPAARFSATDARAYLHANCSNCHRAGSVTGDADLDLRFDRPLAETGLCAEPKVSALGIAGARILAPGDPDKSVLVRRMKALDDTRMPKLATHVVDNAGVAAVEGWVRTLSSCP